MPDWLRPLAGVLVLAISWGAAYVLARALVGSFAAALGAPRRTAAVLAAALLAVVPGTLCRAIGNMPLSMAAAALLFIGASVVLHRRRPVVGLETAEQRAARAGAPLANPAWPGLVIGALLTVLVAIGAVTRNFFDEEAHVPFALVLSRGIVPPVHPLASGQVVPYHWGIDALYAQLVVAGVRPDRTIDLVTIACVLLLLGAASLLGAHLAGRAGATLAVILVPLAGSPLVFPLHEQLGPLQLTPTMYPAAWTVWLKRPPPLTADFFQHPQGLAFPIVLVVLLFATAPSRKTRALGVSLLTLLSLVQAVHFLVLGFGLLSAVVVTGMRTKDARAAFGDAGMLAGSLLGAVALGGFFSPHAGTGAALLWGNSFFADANVWMAMAHHVVAFGLPLLMLPLLLVAPDPARANERLRVTLVAGAGLGFVLPNVVVYAGSWDIVKLYTAAGYLAAVALAWTLAGAWLHASGSASLPRARAQRALIVLAVAVTISFPLAWLSTRTVLPGHLGIPLKNDWRLRDDVLLIGERVRPLIAKDAKLLINDVEHARMTGLSAPGFDAQRYLNGHLIDFQRTRALMSARTAALKDLDPSALQTLAVDYALLTPKDIAKLSPLGKARLDACERVDVSPALPRDIALFRLRSSIRTGS